MSAGAFYYRRTNPDDLQEGAENVGGHLESNRPLGGTALVATTTHFGQLAMVGDSALVLNGQITTDKPPRPKVYVGNRRATEMAVRRKGRTGRRRWGRFIAAVRDSIDVLGELTMVGDATCAFNATVVSPTEVLGELVMQADAAMAAAGGVVLAVMPGEGLDMVGSATMIAAGVEIFGGELVMVGEADMRMRGTGGANASLDPTERHGGIVSIGTRGGH